MKKYKQPIIFIALIISIFIGIYLISEYQCNIDEDEIIIGKLYFHSYHYDDVNPFEESEMDTVEVLDIKDGYVQYKFTHHRNPSSTSIRMFRKVAKQLNP